MNFKYLIKITKIEDLNKIAYLFDDIRFYMGKSVLEGIMGTAYVDDLMNPKFAILIINSYCFISGTVKKEILRDILYELKEYKIIPDNVNKAIIKKEFSNYFNEKNRYSFYKETNFDSEKLEQYIKKLDSNYKIIEINNTIADEMRANKFINITNNYQENGVGCCCVTDNKIIGVASSNIVYKNGIEVNIKVDENFRQKGIGTALASYLILMCINRNLNISWDAANLISVELAKKVGFKYYGSYCIYTYNEKR